MIHKTFVLAIVALLALPGASALWGAKGSFEPDTTKDATEGWMFTTPDTVSVKGASQRDAGNVHKVYFNAFQGTSSNVVGVGFSPNSATLGTAHAMTPNRPYAILGVWKDCNNDGFIGLGDKGLWEYRSEILAALGPTTICKAQSMPAQGFHAGSTQPFAVHNDGVWVHEFLPIGWDTNKPQFADKNMFNINDAKARVWGDYDLPGDPGRLICWISNQPVGTFHSVGQLAEYLDCFAARRFSGAMTTITTLTGTGPQWNQIKATKNPWGEEYDQSYVKAFDCSQPQITHVKVSDPNEFGVSQPMVPQTNLGGSPAGTANETASAMNDCDRSDNQNQDRSEWEASVARGPYQTESETVQAQYSDKHETDWVFSNTEGVRGQTVGTVAPPLGATSAQDAGTGLLNDVWSPGSLSTTYNGFYTAGRDSLDKVKHMTFYAFIDPNLITGMGLSVPKATVGIYGSEACTSGIDNSQPPKNGWKCAPNQWTATARAVPDLCYGTNTGEGCDIQWVRVGQSYQLRDIDCFDESVSAARSASVTWGTIAGGRCA